MHGLNVVPSIIPANVA